jgi:EmrB/QacA subfamily drug resistance transporter
MLDVPSTLDGGESGLPSTSASSIHDLEKPIDARPLSRITTHRSTFGDHGAGAGEDKGLEAGRPPPPEDTMQYPSGIRLVGTVAALILAIFVMALDLTIVSTAIPRITDEFHSLDQVGWYGSAFFLTVASFQSTWGKAYKYFPLKTAFLLAILVFEIGSLICGVAKDSTTLIVGRAIAGAGGAGIASGCYTIIAFSASPAQRPAFTGLLGATYGVASVIGPLLGGVFTERLSWRWCFYINLPIGGAAAFIIFFTFSAPDAAKPTPASLPEKLLQMDPVGTFTIMAAVVCYLLALQWGGVTKPWTDSTVIGTLVGFVLLLIVFLINEYFMGERALLQGRLLRKRIIIVACLYVLFLAGAFFTFLYYLPVYFQSISGVSPSESGVRNLPMILAISLFTVVSGGLISKYGHYVPLMLVSSVFSTIGAGLLYTLEIDSPSAKWIGYQILTGIGLGLGFQIPIIVVQVSVDIADISSISAVLLFVQTIGGSFFVSAGQTAFENTLVGSLATYAPEINPAKVIATGATEIRNVFPNDVQGILLSYLAGLHVVFAMAIVMAGLTMVVAVFAPWRRINASAAVGGA